MPWVPSEFVTRIPTIRSHNRQMWHRCKVALKTSPENFNFKVTRKTGLTPKLKVIYEKPVQHFRWSQTVTAAWQLKFFGRTLWAFKWRLAVLAHTHSSRSSLVPRKANVWRYCMVRFFVLGCSLFSQENIKTTKITWFLVCVVAFLSSALSYLIN